MDDFFMTKYTDSKSIKRKNLEQNELYNDENILMAQLFEQNDFYIDESIIMAKLSEQNIMSESIQEIIVSSHKDIPSIDQMNVSASSITIIPSDTPAKSNNQDDTIKSHTCQYRVLSSSVFYCQNQGTCKCSHCSVSFCLQHALQHQEDLKKEIRHLFSKTLELFDNLQKSKIIDDKSSCTTRLDQWAAIMHEKVDQTRNQLQIILNQFDKKIKEIRDHLKIYLENHLTQNVLYVLIEQLQEIEIDELQLEKACQEFSRLENLFQLINNQHLIIMNIETENQLTLNPPVIVCSDIILDDENFMENPQEKMDLPDQQKNGTHDNPTYRISSHSSFDNSTQHIHLINNNNKMAMTTRAAAVSQQQPSNATTNTVTTESVGKKRLQNKKEKGTQFTTASTSSLLLQSHTTTTAVPSAPSIIDTLPPKRSINNRSLRLSSSYNTSCSTAQQKKVYNVKRKKKLKTMKTWPIVADKIEWHKTKYGNDRIHMGGYIYYLQYRSSHSRAFRCSQQHYGCRAIVHIFNDSNMYNRSNNAGHNHPPHHNEL